MVDRGIVEYIGPTCYTTYVGVVEDAKDEEIILRNVDVYTQIVGRIKWMPGVPRLHIYPPDKEKHLDKVTIKKWYYIHRGIFFDWIINDR